MPVNPTHADVLAAIDNAQEHEYRIFGGGLLSSQVNAHCDDLRATAERHTNDRSACFVCTDRDGLGNSMRVLWPCPDYQQVVDRLTGWGVL